MNPNFNINNPALVYSFLNSNIKTTNEKRFERGEVFTPLSVVNHMLDKLPEEVWSNPNLRWLDPSVGIGNFMALVYERLMIGLMNVITNRKKRQKHILENMLYMVEISPESIAILKTIFCDSQYKLNIFDGSYIDNDENKNVYIPDIKFDIIIGNPPYNQGGIMSSRSKDAPKCKLSLKVLWNVFISKSIDLLNDGGSLLFITPLSWLKLSNKSHRTILNNTITYLELWDAGKSLTEIDGNIPISIFLLKNTLNTEKTPTPIKVIFTRSNTRYLTGDYNAYLDPEESIPFAFHSQISKLCKFVKENKCMIEKGVGKSSRSNYDKIKTLNKKNNELIHMTYDEIINVKAEDNYAVDTYLNNKKVYLVNKLSEPCPEASIRKLMLPNKCILAGYFIDEGKLSLSLSTPNMYYTSDNLELAHKLLGFKLIQVLSASTKYHMELMNRDINKFIPDLSKLGIEDIDEDMFYDLIGLTEKEKEDIYKINTIVA